MIKTLHKLKNGFIVFLTVIFVFCFSYDSFLSAAYGDEEIALSTKAKNGAILIDSFSGEVLFEQDADRIAPVASTTKILSTLIVLENYKNLDEPFVVDSDAINVEGTSMGLKVGDVVTMRDLCYGMMLASGNDAANAAAVRVAGSVENFVKLMNDRVKKLGLKNTYFKTPSGLDVDGCVSKKKLRISAHKHKEDALKMPHSTARDLSVITREAMKNSVFREICATRRAKLSFGNPVCEHVIVNHNKLLNNRLVGEFDATCCGVKTGFTKKAGRCLVSAAKKNGVELIAVVLNDYDDWLDSSNLFKYGFSQFKEIEVKPDVSKVKQVVFNNFENEVNMKLKNPIKIFLTNSMKKRLQIKIKADKFQFAPVKKGEEIGEVVCYVDEKVVGKGVLVSTNEFEC